MRSYKIFQLGESSGQLNVGVEFRLESEVIDRHNLSFSTDITRPALHRELEDILNAKIEGIFRARMLVKRLGEDLNIEKFVVPSDITFDPKPGALVFPKAIALEASLADGQEIIFTLDGSDPKKDSKVYDMPIVLSEATTIRTAIYDKGLGIISPISSASYSS